MTLSHFFAGRAIFPPLSDDLHGSKGAGAAGGAWPSWSRRASAASASSWAPAFRGAAQAVQASPPEFRSVHRAQLQTAGGVGADPLAPSESSAVRSMGDAGALRLAGRASAGDVRSTGRSLTGRSRGAGRRAADGAGRRGFDGAGAGFFFGGGRASPWLSRR